MFLFPSSGNLIFDGLDNWENTKKSAVGAPGRNSTCRCDWQRDLDINEGFQVPTKGRSQCRCNRSGTGSAACGRHWMIIYADDCCLHWQRGLYSHQAVYTCIGCCIFLFWPQYGTLPTAMQLPFLKALLWAQTSRKIPSLLVTSYPDTSSTNIHLWGNSTAVGLLGGWGATLEIGMQLEWRSPLGCPCPQLASGLTSALPSHYSPRAAGGQLYQVEWCYKINWTLHWGKCWRWWTERVPAENQSSSLKPPSESDWDFRAKQLDYRLGMQSELNMSAPAGVARRSSVTFCTLEMLPAHAQCACQKLE